MARMFGKKTPKSPYEKEQKEYEKLVKTARMAAGFISGAPMGMEKPMQRRWLGTWQKFLYTKVYFPFKKFFFDLRNYAVKTFRDILGPLQEYVDLVIDGIKGIFDLAKSIASVVWKGLKGGISKILGVLGIKKAMSSVKDAVLYMTGRMEKKLEEVKDAIVDSSEEQNKARLRGKTAPGKKGGWSDLLLLAIAGLLAWLKSFDLKKIFGDSIGGWIEKIKNSIIDAIKGIGLGKLILDMLKGLKLDQKILELFGLGKEGKFLKWLKGIFGEETLIGKFVGFFSKWFGEGSLFRNVLGKAGSLLKLMDEVLFLGFFGKIFHFAGKFLKMIPILGQIVLAITAALDFFKGYKDEEAMRLFGSDGIFAKVMSGFSHVLSGLTFGIISPDTIAKMLKVLTNGIVWIVDKIVWAGEKMYDFFVWLDKKFNIVETLGKIKDGLINTLESLWTNIKKIPGIGKAIAWLTEPGSNWSKKMANTDLFAPKSAEASVGPNTSPSVIPPSPPLASGHTTTSTGSSSGTAADRNNNPGNIKWDYDKSGTMSGVAKKYSEMGATKGSRATDGGHFIHFPNKEMGIQAAKELVSSGVYNNMTVDEGLKKWSNQGYNAKKLGMAGLGNKKIGSLNPEEKTKLLNSMFAGEGSTTRISQPEMKNVPAGAGGSDAVRRGEDANAKASQIQVEKGTTTGKPNMVNVQTSSAATGGPATTSGSSDNIPTIISGFNILPLFNTM